MNNKLTTQQNLRRLYELRKVRLQRSYSEHKPSLVKAQAEYDQLSAQQSTINDEKNTLAGSAQVASESAWLHQVIKKRADWVDFELEKVTYLANESARELAPVKQESTNKRMAWMRAKNKFELMDSQCDDTRCLVASEEDAVFERELEEFSTMVIAMRGLQ